MGSLFYGYGKVLEFPTSHQKLLEGSIVVPTCQGHMAHEGPMQLAQEIKINFI
jgi:hypothetical protein